MCYIAPGLLDYHWVIHREGEEPRLPGAPQHGAASPVDFAAWHWDALQMGFSMGMNPNHPWLMILIVIIIIVVIWSWIMSIMND